MQRRLTTTKKYEDMQKEKARRASRGEKGCWEERSMRDMFGSSLAAWRRDQTMGETDRMKKGPRKRQVATAMKGREERRTEPV
jgi:hypothetical protein